MFSSLRRSLFGTSADQQEALRQFDPHRPIRREEQLARFHGAMYALYWQAVRSRARARSYRHFCVGCAVFAYREDLAIDGGRFRAFYGLNSKASQESRNICAEPVALDSAASLGYTDALGIIVVGNTQEDERGKTPPTLRPCQHCRAFMQHSPLVKPDTVIITALPPPHEEAELEEIVFEEHSFKELLALYV